MSSLGFWRGIRDNSQVAVRSPLSRPRIETSNSGVRERPAEGKSTPCLPSTPSMRFGETHEAKQLCTYFCSDESNTSGRYESPPLQLARGIGLSVFCQSAFASPVEATSCAPVRSRIRLAFPVHSVSSHCTESKIPPSLILPSYRLASYSGPYRSRFRLFHPRPLRRQFRSTPRLAQRRLRGRHLELSGFLFQLASS